MLKLLRNKSKIRDPEQYFRTNHLKKDLKRRSVRGGAITLATQVCKFSLQMISTIVLARLLMPQDYGLVGMVTAVTGFITLFKDLGLSTATIQRAEINHRQISTLFWVNVAVSLSIALLTAALAPVIAGFYGEPRLIEITLVLASGFIFGGLTVQHQALLNRQMRFTALAGTDIAAMTVGVSVGVLSALNGAGYWALVFMQLSMGVTNCLTVWLLCGWRPGLPHRDSGVLPMLAFGSNLTGFNIMNYFARNLDNILIGRYWGTQQLGLYAKTYQLLLLPIQQINAPIAAVAVPTLSRLADEPKRYRQVYLRILEKLVLLTMPGITLMIVTSDWLIWLVLGPQWQEASRIFAFLGVAGIVQPISNTTGWLFVTQGRTRHMLHWGIISSVLTIAAFVIGLPWGATGVAAAYAISGICVRAPLLYWLVGRRGPVHTVDFYRAMATPAAITLVVLLVLLAFRRWFEISSPALGLAIATALTVGTSLLVLLILPSGRASLQDLYSLVQQLKPGQASSKQPKE